MQRKYPRSQIINHSGAGGRDNLESENIIKNMLARSLLDHTHTHTHEICDPTKNCWQIHVVDLFVCCICVFKKVF